MLVPVPAATDDAELTHARAVCMANGWLPVRPGAIDDVVREAKAEAAFEHAEIGQALLVRAIREIGDPKARAALVEDAARSLPGFADRLPENLRPR